MAGVFFTIESGEEAFDTDDETLVQLVAASNHRVTVHEWSISFIGTSNTATPIRTFVVRQDDAGTSSDGTPVKMNSSDDETLEADMRVDFTGEPTTDTAIIMTEEVHPQTGYTWQAPFGREIIVPGGGRLGIKVDAPAATSGNARMVCEE